MRFGVVLPPGPDTSGLALLAGAKKFPAGLNGVAFRKLSFTIEKFVTLDQVPSGFYSSEVTKTGPREQNNHLPQPGKNPVHRLWDNFYLTIISQAVIK
jgi:hypothetical protein